MAVLLAFPVVSDSPLAAGAARDDGHGSGLPKHALERIRVIAFVRQHVAGTTHAGEQLRPGGHVGDVAGREDQRIRAANDVGERVYVGGPAAARTASRIRPVRSQNSVCLRCYQFHCMQL